MATTSLSPTDIQAAANDYVWGVRSWGIAQKANAAGTVLVTLGTFATLADNYYEGSTARSGTLAIPQTAMAPTDKVRFVANGQFYDDDAGMWSGSLSRVALSASLNASQLDAATWTFARTHWCNSQTVLYGLRTMSVTGIAYTEGSGTTVYPYPYFMNQ